MRNLQMSWRQGFTYNRIKNKLQHINFFLYKNYLLFFYQEVAGIHASVRQNHFLRKYVDIILTKVRNETKFHKQYFSSCIYCAFSACTLGSFECHFTSVSHKVPRRDGNKCGNLSRGPECPSHQKSPS